MLSTFPRHRLSGQGYSTGVRVRLNSGMESCLRLATSPAVSDNFGRRLRLRLVILRRATLPPAAVWQLSTGLDALECHWCCSNTDSWLSQFCSTTNFAPSLPKKTKTVSDLLFSVAPHLATPTLNGAATRLKALLTSGLNSLNWFKCSWTACIDAATAQIQTCHNFDISAGNNNDQALTRPSYKMSQISQIYLCRGRGKTFGRTQTLQNRSFYVKIQV